MPDAIAHMHPTTLVRFMIRKFGKEWLDMEPGALWEEMELRGIDYDRQDADYIMALRAAVRSNAAWKDWNVFLNTASALNDLGMNAEALPELTPSQLAWGITQLRRIDEKDKFSEEVCMVIAGIIFQHGIYWIPEGSPLSIAKPYLNRLTWRKISQDETLEKLYDKLKEGYRNPLSCVSDEQRIHSEKLHLIEEYLTLSQDGE